LERGIKVIDKYRQTGDMVHVRMRDNDIADLVPLFLGERDCDATCVYCHAVVNQKTGKALLRSCMALTIKSAR
jgi:hypothetical protein